MIALQAIFFFCFQVDSIKVLNMFFEHLDNNTLAK